MIIEASAKYYNNPIVEAANMFLVLDENRIIKYANRHFCRLTGYSEDDLIKKSIYRIFHHDFPDKIDNEIWQKVNNKKMWLGELQIVSKNQKKLWVFSRILPIIDEKKGKIVEYVVLSNNITKLKETELELIKARDKAEREKLKAIKANRSKSLFFASMTHDLRTPLNAILGYSDILLAKNDLDEEEKEILNTIKFSAESLRDLVTDILDYSQLEAGKLYISKIEFDINDTIDKIFKTMESLASTKNIELILDKDEFTEDIIGDPGRLRQALINLLGNAIKFTQNGYVKLKVKKNFEDDENIEIYFEVEDTGIGIDKDKIETIFKEFSQEDEKVYEKCGGTGLGLFVTKKIIELHGGKIDVESEKGKGSRFFFTIKFRKSKNIPFTPKKDVSGNLISKYTILSVDSCDINQALIAIILKEYKLRFAKSAEEALKILRNEKIDLILTDVKLPLMNGVEFIQKLKEDYKDTPVFVLTGYFYSPMQKAKEAYLRLGFDEYVPKPIRVTEFKKLIKKYLKE
ncbi:PAS domain-containing hybrid sensor histidine kinase/response regulator [Nitrosophilus kaiyonis]|uniref:PAS domain-containing hybrid sensor histidine kinase/response regulator n=1 Tax=Nitrosophilus kaiyonis TaxID=2930200 RepID=UPI002491F798|nr:ATP-binding protein [Nitrosophilus kaiyonis]